MGDVLYTGNAFKVAQVDTFTPAEPNTDDIYYLTVTGLDGSTHRVSFTVGATETVAAVTAGLAAAWEASENALCTPIIATDNTTTVSLTAEVAGVAFSVASSVYDGSGGNPPTLGRAATTANAGPLDWSSAGNWDIDAVPGGAGSQDVYVNGATILYGLDQSGIGNTLDSLHISQSQIGSNPAATNPVIYLQIKATLLLIGEHYGPGIASQSAPINIDLGATASTVTVHNGGANSTMPGIRLKANSASTNIRVHKGSVGIAHEAGETATVDTVTVSYVSNRSNDADVFIGKGCTLTTFVQDGGDADIRCAFTTGTVDAGNLETNGSGAITTLNGNGGNIISNSSGTITNCNAVGANIDFTKSAAARTVTNMKVDKPGVLKMDPDSLTITNWIAPSGAIILTASAA